MRQKKKGFYKSLTQTFEGWKRRAWQLHGELPRKGKKVRERPELQHPPYGAPAQVSGGFISILKSFIRTRKKVRKM